MAFVLMLHSILRWVIVVVGVFALIKFLVGWARKSEFAKMDRGLSAGFGLVDGAGFPMVRIEHMITMLVAAVLGHLPAILKKAENKYAVAFYAVIGALIVIVLGVYRLPGGWSR